jgi:hypothetical protein
VPSRIKRTVIDGIKNVKLRKTADIFKNKRLSQFIDNNSTEGKKELLEHKLNQLKIKNEKEYIKNKTYRAESPFLEQSIIECSEQ